jgi:thiamine pyrophosphokinase
MEIPEITLKKLQNYLKKENSFWIFIDGGTKHALRPLNWTSIGDQDSSTKNTILQNILPKNKDRSDFFHALRLIPSTAIEIFAYGLLGGRKDHEIFNIGEAYNFLAGQHFQSINFENKIIVYNKGSFKLQFNQFSIASLFKQKIKINSTSYDGEFELIPLSSQGLSNISPTKEFLIKASGPFILYNND